MSLNPEKPSPIVPGYRLDRYEFLCPIATGGMASVWVARLQGKHGFEKLVAIKTILPRYAHDLKFQQMFLDEARISAGIEHANVAQILDLGDEQGILYLVMEWVDGDSLSKLQRAVERKGTLVPFGISLRILADACAGLHAANELRGKDGAPLGVVHRDVSPQNILVASKGAAKVIDFGIAKARDRLAGETNTGLLKGKVQYMAPEQALGQETDRRADVWAVGAVLYHLATGRPPFEGPNQLATLHLLTSGRPPLPMPATVPGSVQSVIRKALSHDKAKRYASAADLQRALEQAMLDDGLTTTIADVAAFNAEHLADRAEARRKAVELALSAAAERARVQTLLRPTSNDFSTSDQIGAKVATLSLTPVAPDPSSPLHVQARLVAAGPAADAESALGQPLSETSSAGLGAAGSLASSVAKRPAGRKWGAAAAAALALAAIAGFATVRHPENAGDERVAAMAASTAGPLAPRAVAAIVSEPSPSSSPAIDAAPGVASPTAPSMRPSTPASTVVPASPRAPRTSSGAVDAGAKKRRLDYGF